jgi:transglutaminase-like putative cysteine protease
MFVQRMLQISIATLTVLGPLLLGAGDRFPVLPLWVLVAAVTSLWVTDTVGWLRLNRTLTNVAAVAAVALSLSELSQFRGGGDILSIARLLAYLQVILLFQQKEFRTYWQLVVLSLLQVIVAAAFNQGASFGLLLVVYLFVAIVTLALFFLYRERVLAEGRDGEKVRPAGDARPAPSPPPAATQPAPAGSPSRWPWIDQKPEFASSRRAMPSGLGREFWWRVLRITLGSMLLTALIFSAVPRLGSGAWYGTGLALQRMVGFSDVVTLGALGSVIENPQEVLTAEFRDPDTDEPYQVAGGVYFRGAVLSFYSDGRWDTRGRARYPGGQIELGPLSPVISEGLVHQEITIQPMDREELFCVWPFVAIDEDERLHYDAYRQRLLRPGDATTRFSYRLGTTAFRNHLQKPLVPVQDSFPPHDLLAMPADYGSRDVPELIRVAGEWLDEAKIPEQDGYHRAIWLEHMFRDSGQFEYSLQGQPRQAGIDPVDDFVKNNRRGHCEYFATALALMLRSRGIPARVVVGFKTNEWNELGQFYQVRQLHAHTWVEAYLQPEQIPPEVLHADRPWQWMNGGWLRLDPTPAARDLGLEGGGSLWSRMDSYLSWLDYVWSSYVMDMDKPLQEEAIYNPLVTALRTVWNKLTDVEFWRSLLGALGDYFENALARLAGGRLMSWRGLLAATAVLAGATLLYSRLRRLLRRRPDADPTHPSAARRHAQVEFYRRLESLLRRFGLVRTATQTQREFADSAAAAIYDSTGAAGLSGLPAEVVEAFYRVRFGGAALDKNQTEAVERALADLAEAAAQRRSHEDRVGRISGVG